MNDKGSTFKFRNARSAFRNLQVDPLSFIPPWETNKYNSILIFILYQTCLVLAIKYPFLNTQQGGIQNSRRSSRCRIELWPHWISTRGVLIQRAVTRVRIPRQNVTRVIIPHWIVTRVKILRWNVTPAHNSTLNCDPRSWFHVEIRPQVSIQRWIVTPSHDSTLNCHLVLGSQFNVEFWPRVIIQSGILTRGYNSTWNSDPSTYLLPVELRLKKVSKFNSVIKIQQLKWVTIQRQIYWILTPGRYSIGGQNFILHRLIRHVCFFMKKLMSKIVLCSSSQKILGVYVNILAEKRNSVYLKLLYK